MLRCQHFQLWFNISEAIEFAPNDLWRFLSKDPDDMNDSAGSDHYHAELFCACP